MNKYTYIATAGLVLWLTESCLFGWNQHAQTAAEAILDQISWIMIFWGIVGDICKNLTIVKKENFNIKNATINGINFKSKKD